MRLLNKKGLTLVEVVVALAIITLVFAGTVTLIINVVNLTVLAREKTTVIAWAQDGLARMIQQTGQGCTSASVADIVETKDKYQLRVHLSDEYVSYGGGNNIVTVDPTGDYRQIVATITGPMNYRISQVLRVRR